jgi:hypothetical protein
MKSHSLPDNLLWLAFTEQMWQLLILEVAAAAAKYWSILFASAWMTKEKNAANKRGWKRSSA